MYIRVLFGDISLDVMYTMNISKSIKVDRTYFLTIHLQLFFFFSIVHVLRKCVNYFTVPACSVPVKLRPEWFSM